MNSHSNEGDGNNFKWWSCATPTLQRMIVTWWNSQTPFFRNWPTEYYSVIYLLYHQEYPMLLHIDITRLCSLIEHVLFVPSEPPELHLLEKFIPKIGQNMSKNDQNCKNEVSILIIRTSDNALYLHSIIYTSDQNYISLSTLCKVPCRERNFVKNERVINFNLRIISTKMSK